MTAYEFQKAGQALYGRHGWKTQLAEVLGMSRGTITRYAQGTLTVPVRVKLAMDALAAVKA